MDEVNTGSQEQAQGISQISQAIVQMEQVTQRTAASAEESAAAAEELNAQSEALKVVVKHLTALVGGGGAAGGAATRDRGRKYAQPPAPDAATYRGNHAAQTAVETQAFPLDDDFGDPGARS